MLKMKPSLFIKVFLGFSFLTVFAFSFAGYSAKKAQATNPNIVDNIAKHFNVTISNSGSGVYITGIDPAYEKGERQWDFDSRLENIKISTTGADITIEPSTDGKTHVNASGYKTDMFEVTMDKHDLSVSGLELKTKDILIKVQSPESKVKTLKISTASGDIKISGIKADKLDTITISGDTDLEATSIQTLALKTTSGDIKIDDNFANEMDLKSISGDVSVKSPKLESANYALKTLSGTITNPYENKPTAKNNITIQTVSGDIEIESIE
jgi:DUF4097 and DUF4098 domain-containing protein YvlB